MELKILSLKEIKPYEKNPRRNDGAVEAVMESIKQCSYVSPIIVDEDMVILAGHTRFKALKKLGRTECEVIIKTGLSEEQKRKYRILDNKTNEFAIWDDDLLSEELLGLDFEGFDFGFEEIISPDDYGEDFTLPDGDKPEICQMTFTLHQRQRELIEYAMGIAADYISETFGNTNKNGNALYEVIRQWAEQRR